MGIVGRKYEVDLLEISCNSEKTELISVYGRRRVGKTFLIRQYFGDKFDFYMTDKYNNVANCFGNKRKRARICILHL